MIVRFPTTTMLLASLIFEHLSDLRSKHPTVTMEQIHTAIFIAVSRLADEEI